jgi:hypothetical protein
VFAGGVNRAARRRAPREVYEPEPRPASPRACIPRALGNSAGMYIGIGTLIIIIILLIILL